MGEVVPSIAGIEITPDERCRPGEIFLGDPKVIERHLAGRERMDRFYEELEAFWGAMEVPWP